MIIFLFPVYNEEDNIEKLLENVASYADERKKDYRICLVDDGSTDDTVKMVKGLKNNYPVEIVANPVNMGPGVAFDRGFRHILSTALSGDIIVTMEADNTSDLAILDEMLKRTQNGADLVLASCYAEGGRIEGTSLFRMLCSKCANYLVKCISPIKGIRTFSSFYRCYKSGLLKRAYEAYGVNFIEEKGFVCAVDILLKLERLQISIDEVPMVLRGDKREGKSKMRTVWTVIAYARLFIREVFRLSVNSKKPVKLKNRKLQ